MDYKSFLRLGDDDPRESAKEWINNNDVKVVSICHSDAKSDTDTDKQRRQFRQSSDYDYDTTDYPPLGTPSEVTVWYEEN